MSRTASHFGVMGLYLLAFYALTFPALHSIHTELFADAGDGPQNFWNNWWVRHAVANGKNPWYTDMLYAPDGVTLVGATLNPFNGFVTVPLCWFVGPVTAYNLMVVFAFVFGGYTTFLLAREIGASYWPGAFAGAAFTFGPFHFAHALGHMQLVSLQWLPFFFFAWIRLLRAPSYGRATVAASALSLNLLCDYYYTLYSILGGFVLFVCKGCFDRRPLFFAQRATLLPLLLFVALCIVLCGPLLFSLVGLYSGGGLQGSHAGDPYVNDLFGWIIPGRAWRFHELTEWFSSTHPLGEHWSEFGSHVGVLVVGFAGFALWRCRRQGDARIAWCVFTLGVVFYSLSLGPTLLVFGEFHPWVPMPFQLLETVFPMMRLSGVPCRMAVVSCLAAAVLAGLGLTYAGPLFRRRRWLVLPLLAVFAFEILPRPLVRSQVDFPPAIQALRGFPDGIVTGTDTNVSWPLLFQTCFEKPLTNGYVARVPEAHAEWRWEQACLMREGRHSELMEKTGARYLLLEYGISTDVAIQTELKCVARDPQYAVFTRRDEKFPETDFPRMTYRVRSTPGQAHLELHWPSMANRELLGLFSASLAEPRIFESKEILLEDDRVFRMCLREDGMLFENQRSFDAEGRASITIKTHLMQEAKQRLWFSIGIRNRQARNHLVQVTKPRPIEIEK